MMSLTTGVAFSHFHKWSFILFCVSHCRHPLVSYNVHFLFRMLIVESVLVMDFTKYDLSVEVFDKLKSLLIFPSGCKRCLVECQSISKVLAVSMIKSEVWCIVQLPRHMFWVR